MLPILTQLTPGTTIRPTQCMALLSGTVKKPGAAFGTLRCCRALKNVNLPDSFILQNTQESNCYNSNYEKNAEK